MKIEHPVQDSESLKGYMGHDNYSVQNGTIIRNFPIYGPNTPNVDRGSKIAQLTYKLVQDTDAPVLRYTAFQVQNSDTR